jgi:hypothetical protein
LNSKLGSTLLAAVAFASDADALRGNAGARIALDAESAHPEMVDFGSSLPPCGGISHRFLCGGRCSAGRSGFETAGVVSYVEDLQS